MGLNSKNANMRKDGCHLGKLWSIFPVTVLIFLFCWKPDPLESATNSASSLKHEHVTRQLGELEGQESSQPMKILYTITSLAEYNTGARATVKGSDRLQETLIPVIAEGVRSMLEFGYQVDVFIVSHYFMRPERLQLIRDSLPEGVGLEYWDDAVSAAEAHMSAVLGLLREGCFRFLMLSHFPSFIDASGLRHWSVQTK